MSDTRTLHIKSELHLENKFAAAAVSPLPCVIAVGMSEHLYDEFGSVRLHLADAIAAGGVAMSHGWCASDATVGHVKVDSVVTNGDSEAYRAWLNANLPSADLEVTIDAAAVRWEARFPDGRELSTSASFHALRDLFGRFPSADSFRAVYIIGGYDDAANVRELYTSDKRFAQAVDTLLPQFQPNDWTQGKVDYLLRTVGEPDEKLVLSKREKAFAVLRHFGDKTPMLAAYDAEPRFQQAMNMLVANFDRTHWHRDDSIESVITYIERHSAAARQTRSFSM